MTLYETIFKRRSVRKYDMTPLDDSVLGDIRKFIDETEQLPGQNARFEIVSSDMVKGAAAPHYIMCVLFRKTLISSADSINAGAI